MTEIQNLLNFSAPGPYHIRDNKLYAGDIELLSASSKYGLPLLEILGSQKFTSLLNSEERIKELEAEVSELTSLKEDLEYEVDGLKDEIEDLEDKLEDELKLKSKTNM